MSGAVILNLPIDPCNPVSDDVEELCDIEVACDVLPPAAEGIRCCAWCCGAAAVVVVVKGYVVPLRGVAECWKAIGLAPPLCSELDWADTDGYSGGMPPNDEKVVVSVCCVEGCCCAVGVLALELLCVGHFVPSGLYGATDVGVVPVPWAAAAHPGTVAGAV